jgi:hypothetical protein
MKFKRPESQMKAYKPIKTARTILIYNISKLNNNFCREKGAKALSYMVISNLKTISTTTIYLSKGKQRKMSIEASLLALTFKINKAKAKKYISKTCGELGRTRNQTAHKVKGLAPSISLNQGI